MPGLEHFQPVGGDISDENLRVMYHAEAGFVDMRVDPESDVAKAEVTFVEQPSWESLSVTNSSMTANALRRALQNDLDSVRFASSALGMLRNTEKAGEITEELSNNARN